MEGEHALSSPLHDRSKKPGVERSTYGVAMSLNLGRRIFLSHSGIDKDFVRFLHEKLCGRYHDDMVVFFDEETLPKGKAITMENILGEARRSQLGVLVLTEAFFVQTANPMLELEAFVASEVKLLPLFFGMSVKKFKEKKQSRSLEEHWRMNFAKELGGRRSVEEGIVAWKQALDHVTVFNGLEYEKTATNALKYIHEIVNKVTSIILSTSFTKEGICEKKRLCQMVDNMYKDCAKKYSGSTSLDVVGIYGFSGLGKTTLCKCLCDFYFTKFSGKVWYIELQPLGADQASSQKSSFLSRMKSVLLMLGMCTNDDFFNFKDIDWVKNWFKEKISLMKDPIFLAIDNILPEREYQEEILQLEDLCFVDMKEHKILDLIVDYSKYKASQGELKSEYVVLEDGAPRLDDSPRTATTVSISRCTGHHMVDLRNVEGVKVLHIVDNAGLQEVLLSRATTARLRSLIVRVPAGTSLIFYTIDEDWSSMSTPYTGGCLQWFGLKGDVCFGSLRLSLMSPSNVLPNSLREVEITSARVSPDLVALLGGLRKLEHLELSELPGVRCIDATTCSNLKVLRLHSMPRLELVNAGFENSNLERVRIRSCPELLALTGIPAHSEADILIYNCDSLERISFCAMSSECAGALSSPTRPGQFFVRNCPAVTNIEGLSQYTGSFGVARSAIGIKRPSRACMTSMGEICGGSGLQLDAGFDLSLFSATIKELTITEKNSAGARLASATSIQLMDAQHAGLFISALFKAQPKDLTDLSVYCKEGVDYGCDQNVPQFGPLPSPRTPERGLHIIYECRQVKDLAGLVQCHVLEDLTLWGCTSVEIWPDFAAMTLLRSLSLSYTSLKEWPTGVLRLSHLKFFHIFGCRQLPAEELIKVAKFALQPTTLSNDICIMGSLQALVTDLGNKERDRCSVADALDAVYSEFVALLDNSHPSLGHKFVELKRETLTNVIRIMYELWFGEVDSEEERLHIRTRMRPLLCSERFFAFSFRACSQDGLSEAWDHPSHRYHLGDAGLMGIALAGSSIAWYEAPVDDDLRDRIIVFLKSFTELHTPYGSFEDRKYSKVSERIENMVRKITKPWSVEDGEYMRQRVGEGVCKMARVGSVAAELGETFLHTIIHDLEADLERMISSDKTDEADYTRRDEAEYTSTDEADSSDYHTADEADYTSTDEADSSDYHSADEADISFNWNRS